MNIHFKKLETTFSKNIIFPNNLERIDKQEMKLLIGGGDPTSAQVQALLSSLGNVFVQGSTDAHGQQVWQDFNSQISLLAATNVGYDMLNQIVSTANGRHINITATNAPNGAVAQYKDNQAGGNLLLGLLTFDTTRQPTDWDYTKQDALHFGTISHELFHAFMYFTTGNPSAYDQSVRSELDAFLFEGMANAEVDEKKNLNNSSDLTKAYSYWDYNMYDGPITPQGVNPTSEYNFKTAYYDIFHNKNFTQANYNTLIENFKTGSSQGVAYATLNNYTVSDIDLTTFNSSAIGQLYSQHYSQSSYYNNLPPFPFTAPQNNGSTTNPTLSDIVSSLSTPNGSNSSNLSSSTIYQNLNLLNNDPYAQAQYLTQLLNQYVSGFLAPQATTTYLMSLFGLAPATTSNGNTGGSGSVSGATGWNIDENGNPQGYLQ